MNVCESNEVPGTQEPSRLIWRLFAPLSFSETSIARRFFCCGAMIQPKPESVKMSGSSKPPLKSDGSRAFSSDRNSANDSVKAVGGKGSCDRSLVVSVEGGVDSKRVGGMT